MQLTIKTLKGQTFQVQVQPNQTILQIKQKVRESKGIQIQSQKLVFKGKATNNNDQLQKIGVKEGDFLVVMSLVKKPQPKPKVEETKNQKKQQKMEQQKKQEEKKQKKEQIKQQKSEEAKKEYEQKVNNLILMGFPKDQCQKALRAAFLNQERAVQYLCNGIPENPVNVPQQQGGGSGALGSALLGGLVNSPQFSQVREMLRSDPSALQPILQQLSQTAPQLYNLIAQYPQEFERMILQGGDGQQGDFSGQQDIQGIQGPPGQILITAQDQAAINRLAELGFPKIEAAQAYMACQKNQQFAANLLFERQANGDFDEQLGDFQQQGGDGGQGDGDDDNLFN